MYVMRKYCQDNSFINIPFAPRHKQLTLHRRCQNIPKGTRIPFYYTIYTISHGFLSVNVNLYYGLSHKATISATFSHNMQYRILIIAILNGTLSPDIPVKSQYAV